MIKSLPLLLLILVTSPLVKAQNRYAKPVQNSLEQYTPLNMSYVIQAAAAVQARYETNQAFRDKLIAYLFDVKGKTDDAQLLADLDIYYRQLRDMDGQHFDALGNQLSTIRNDIAEAIDKAHTRAREVAESNKQSDVSEKKSADDPQLLWNLAREDFDKGDYEIAAAQLSNFIKIEPNYPAAYLLRGHSFMNDKQYDAALSDFDLYISMNRRDPEGYYLRGRLRMSIDDYRGAVKDFTNGLILKPSSKGYFDRGWAKSKTGNNDGAISDYSKAISLRPQFPAAYNNRGWIKFKKHQYLAALLDVNKALKQDDTYAVAYDSRQEIKFALKDYKGCLTDCNIAIVYDSTLSNSYLFRGRVYFRQGKKDAACQEWKTASQQGNTTADNFLQIFCKETASENY